MQRYGLNAQNSCVIVSNEDNSVYRGELVDQTLIKVCPYTKKSSVDRVLCTANRLCTMLVYAMQRTNVGLHLDSDISFNN